MRLRYTTEDGEKRSISIYMVKRIENFRWEVLQSNDKEHKSIKIILLDGFEWIICIDHESYTISNDTNLYKLVTFAEVFGNWQSKSDNILFDVDGGNINNWSVVNHNTGGEVEMPWL